MKLRELREKLSKINEKEDNIEIVIDVNNKLYKVNFVSIRNITKRHEYHRCLWIVGGENLIKEQLL